MDEHRIHYRQVKETYKQEIFPYSQTLLHSFYHSLRLRLLKELALGQTGRILDIGCCDGYFLLTTPESIHLRIGVDIVPEALKDAKKRAKSLRRQGETEFVLSDAEKLVLRDSSINVIISGQVLEHVPDPLTFLKECNRVLKPGGRLVFSLPTVHFMKMILAKATRRRALFRCYLHQSEYSFIKGKGVTPLKELFEKLESLGFRITKKYNLGVFYLIFSALARFMLVGRVLETIELELSSRIPLLLGGVLIVIEAKKEQSRIKR